jgi:hypothetical protein
MNKNIKSIALIISVLILFATSSCKRYVEPPAYFEEAGDTSKPVTRKLLIIGIDGAVGSEYKAIQPPVLMGLKEHSKFTWDGVSDEVTTDAASWKTLMTGISYSRHQIKDSSFIYTQPAGGAEHSAPVVFPSFFNYILSSAKSDMKTSFISPWEIMINRLVPEVEDKVFAATDVAVKDSALIRVKNAKSDLVIVNFNSVAAAGKANGFSATSNGYKDAVLKVDGYVGELMAALKARPGYNTSEEWLVIITGTHGGVGNTYGGPSEKETNVFSFYYNERLKPVEFIKGGAFSGIQFKGRDAAAVKAQVLNDGGLYDPGTGQQTFQIKIKGSGPGAYPHFISKTEKFTLPGWTIFTSGATWALSIRSTTTGERRIQAATPNVFDNQWHTLTFVIYDSASSRWVKRFTDDQRVVDVTSTVNLGATYGSISSVAPLSLGWGSDPSMGAVTYYSSDIRIFNTALTDAEVRNNLCLTDITSHPKYNNLIGYWPGDDGFGGRFRNKAPNSSLDFMLSGPFQWTGVPELPCQIPGVAPNPALTPLLVKAVDVVTTAFYWLRIPTQSSWGLEGTTWLNQYEAEFIKL